MERRALAGLLDEADDMLSPWEEARCAAMRHAEARAVRRAAHALKRRHVGSIVGILPSDLSFVESDGTPRLSPPFDAALHLSLSHTHGAIAFAAASRPVGIDIEPVRRALNWDRLAARRFARGEAEFYAAAADPAQAFTRGWCAKEALMKARGLTLGQALALDCTKVREEPTLLHGAVVHAWSPDPQFCCALAQTSDS